MSHPTDDFPKMLRKLGDLIQVAKAIPVNAENAWKAHGQLLLIKTFVHLSSISTLAQSAIGTSGQTNHRYIDHGSIAVLGRSAYETYVLFNFIFLEQDRDLRIFRHQVWRLSGLQSRAKLNRPKTLPLAVIAQIEREEQELTRLQGVVTSSPYFAELDSQTQRNVRRGDGVRLGAALIDLAVEAGLPRLYSSDMYTHFCNYSHAGAISVFQIQEALNNGTSPILARANIGFCCILLAQIIKAYAEFFDEIDAAVSSDSELRDLLAMWSGIRNSFAHMY